MATSNLRTERLIEVEDGALQVILTGDGERLMCVAASTGVAPPSFDDVLGEFGTLVRVAPRGVGHSSPVRDWRDTTFERLVEDLEAVRQGLGGKRWLYAVGHSRAGFIGLLYALRYPEALSGLILAGTAASGHFRDEPDSINSPSRPDGAHNLELVIRARAPDATPEEKRRYAELFYHQRAVQDAFVTRSAAGDDGLPPEVPELLRAMIAQMHGTPPYARYDVTDRLGEIRVPTLILHGRHDNMVPLRWGERLAERIPGAELVVLEESKHFVLEEEPERVRAAVRRFIAERVQQQPAE